MKASRSQSALPLAVQRALRKLGADVSTARRRRNLTVAIVAERAFVGRNTITRVERGDPGVSLGIYATVLFVLGLADRLMDLADPAADAVGLSLEAERLPQRVRATPHHLELAMERDLEVHLDWQGETLFIGRLWARARGARETATFEYDRAWLGRREAFSLDPNLPLTSGQFQSERGLFNAFTDPAPDRWGRNLMARRERRNAKAEGRAPRTLLDADFLTLVEDETRMGALRFRDVGAHVFLSQADRPVPPLVALPRLLGAATRVIADQESDDDLRLLLAPGSSLGGARPKASVRDGEGRLLIAKFPSQTDDWPIPRWEATATTLAERAGVVVPPWRLELVARRPVFMISRFDRQADGQRVPFISALTALGAADGDSRSYIELVEVLRRDGAAVTEDAAQLWRRMVFNILISNTDDHLRNHGYLRTHAGWRLAPAYDLNPVPTDVKPRVHSLALDEIHDEASLDIALGVAPSFGLAHAEALGIAADVGGAVSGWRAVAANCGLTATQVERMQSAFAHEDLEKATGARPLVAPPDGAVADGGQTGRLKRRYL